LAYVGFNHRLTIREQIVFAEIDGWEQAMESNQRFYMRRAAEERSAARRAMTEQARGWHAKLAVEFAERAAVGNSMAVPA